MHPGEVALERSDAGVAIVSLTGEHDLFTAPEVRRRIDEALSDGGGLVIDLSSAEFVDSAILGALLDARRRADEAGIGFAAALEEGAPVVNRVMEITGLDVNLPVRPTGREAIELAAAGRMEAVQ